MTKIGDCYYSDDGQSEYSVERTHDGYVVVRGDGDRADFDDPDEAHTAARKLAEGDEDDSEYDWN